MAVMLWGKVYFQDTYVGILKQEANGRYVFAYDASYLSSSLPAIAFSLPLREEPFISERGLHPFFDNLVAEGWFQNAQSRALGVSPNDRFSLLLGFGFDLAGGISIIDPEPREHRRVDHDAVMIAASQSRASLSGIQSKLLVVKEGNHYRPTTGKELSTHIAKFQSRTLEDILELEYLTTLAIRELIPNDEVVNMEMNFVHLEKEKREALIIKRFDRTDSGKRLHFEEFNQLLGHESDGKYNGFYEEMGNFIFEEAGLAEADKLYRRILACFMVGNTDAHFKNFAMFHTRDGLRLTPAYDLVASAKYPEFQALALGVAGVKNLDIGELKPKHLIEMANAKNGFRLNENAINTAVNEIGKRLPQAQSAISRSEIGAFSLREKLIEMMEKRWKGNFELIGKLLSKKQSKGERNKS